MARIPIILMGMGPAIGGRVASKLRPEFDTIQFITSIARAKSEIPTIQAGQEPPHDPDNVGSHDFSQRPGVVVFGRAYDDKAVEEIRRHCGGSESGLAWVLSTNEARAKTLKGAPSMSDQNAVGQYADRSTAVTKALLEQLRQEGKLGKDGVYRYGE